MTTENALLVIKELINKSVKKGVFESAEEVINVSTAFNLIVQETTKEIVPDENSKKAIS
jgi:hypothetical protein